MVDPKTLRIGMIVKLRDDIEDGHSGVVFASKYRGRVVEICELRDGGNDVKFTEDSRSYLWYADVIERVIDESDECISKSVSDVGGFLDGFCA